MKNIIFIIIFLYSVNSFAQNPSSKILEPITFGIADKQGGSLGLSFMPPEEEGWELKRSKNGVSVIKNGVSKDEIKEIEGYIIQLDIPVDPISSYVEQIKKNTQEGYANNPRFKINTFEVIPDPSKPRCVRYR